MPTYKFYDTAANTEIELFMTITEMEAHLEQNPHLQPLINGAPGIGDAIRMGLRKPDSAFRDRLKEIKNFHSKGMTGSTINDF